MMQEKDIEFPLETSVFINLSASATFNVYEKTITCFANFIVPIAQQTTKVYSNTVNVILPSATANLVNITVTSANAELFGIQASGQTDSTYFLSINGQDTFRFLASAVSPNVEYKLPIPLTLNIGDVILLYVENNDNINNGQSMGTILGNLT